MSIIPTYESDEEVTEIIDRLSGPLFKRPKIKKSNPNVKRYGITLNIQPTRFINKRQWKLYNVNQQLAILSRMEASIRRKAKDIKLIELHFEKCPTVKNVHFHALYEMPPASISLLQAEWDRLVGTIITKSTRTDMSATWKHLDVKEMIGGDSEWLKYIRKESLGGK